MTKNREAISTTIWKQIAAVVKAYVIQTDKRRAHLAELQRIDADSALEVAKNQSIIIREMV